MENQEDVYSPLDLRKNQQEDIGTAPEKTMVEGTEVTSVLKEKNTEHRNIVARRNKEEGKRVSPPNVKVPPKKVFGFPERYRSPTDSIMSPTSRGLLARNRRSMRPIELPAYVPPKAMENTVQSVGSPPV
eukprot:Gb_26295 [translate_table: standard]